MILSDHDLIDEYTDRGWWGTDTIWDIFDGVASRRPDDVAVVDPPNRADFTVGDPQRLTYSQLRAPVTNLAANLQGMGIGKDDVVMVQLPNVVELVMVYLAAARIGAIVSPVPVQYRTYDLGRVMRLAEPKAFITASTIAGFGHIELVLGLRNDHPTLETIIALGGELPAGVHSFTDLLEEPIEAPAWPEVSANDILTICWTSGTEADPKGVPRSHNHWIWIAYASVDGCRFEAGHKLLNPFPLINMAGIGGMLVPWLLCDGKLVLHQPFDLMTFLGQIPAEDIDYTVAPPALLNMLLMKPELLAQVDLSSLKNIGSGSAPLSPWMVEQWQNTYGLHVLNIFGSNEGASFTSDATDFPDPIDRARYFPRFGVEGLEWSSRIAEQMSTKLVDGDGRTITEPGVPGEMAIRSPGIFPGYFRRPDLTEQAFDDEGFFLTGDLFEIGDDGKDRYYRYVGRSKDVVNRGGVNISSEEIEGLVTSHPKVAEVAVIGHPDERLGERICAVVAPAPGEEITLDEIVVHLQEQEVAVFKLPELLHVVDSLPRNPLGKVLKRELRDRLTSDA